MAVAERPFDPEDVRVTLAGTPAAGEDWIVTIGATEFRYTVIGSPSLDTLADIADGLAALISVDARFAAIGDGVEIKITFNAVASGENWTLNVGSET